MKKTFSVGWKKPCMKRGEVQEGDREILRLLEGVHRAFRKRGFQEKDINPRE